MSPKIRAVFFKELRDSLRDRRTVFATIFVPMFIYPVMMLLTVEVQQMQRTKLRQQTHEVAVPAGTKNFFESLKDVPEPEKSGDTEVNPTLEIGKPNRVSKSLNQQVDPANPALKFIEMPLDAAEDALASGTIRAIIIPNKEFESNIAEQKPAMVEVKFDRAEQSSQDAYNRIRTLLDRYRASLVDSGLKKSGLGHSALEPFSITSVNIAQPAKVGGFFMGSFFPLLFIMMIITGAIYPAIDMTAGEKERLTLETLIGMPVRPIEIISGKFLAVATMALGNAFMNVCSFGLSMMPLSKLAGFEFPWAALPWTLLLLLPLALFFAGILLAVASFAANQKEAQIYCLPVYLVPILGMMAVMTPGIELEGPLLLAPVLNTSLLIKELFLSHDTGHKLPFVFFSTCLYAAGAVAFAARIFAREEVLFSAQGSLRLFLSRRFFRSSATPRAGDSLLLAALLYPLNFYVQLYLQSMLLDKDKGFTTAGFAIAVGVPIWLLFGAVPVLVSKYLKSELKTTFLWHMPSLRAVAGAILLAGGTFFIVQEMVAIQSRIWPYPVEVDLLSKFFQEKTQSLAGILMLIFFIGITPGVCEEHFFRGFLQQGLSRKEKWLSLITVGVIFGAYHSPFWKMPITATMGVSLAYVAWETGSIWPGVIYHSLYNSMTVLMPMLFGSGTEEKTDAGRIAPHVPLQYLLPGIVLFIAGILLVRKSSPRPKGSGSRIPTLTPELQSSAS